MKKLLTILVAIILFGCFQKEEVRYAIKEYTGTVRYDDKGEFNLYLQFYTKKSKDYCEIKISGDGQTKIYHSESSGYGFPYTLKNSDLSNIIPLSYSLIWNPSQAAYDTLEGESEDGAIYAILTPNDFIPIVGGGTYSKRCQATTLQGTQCKRNAESGSIYCWQHKYNH